MCGIVFRLRNGDFDESDEEEWRTVVALNALRGPDAQNTKEVQLEHVKAQFFSSVLHLRGDQIAVQPYEREGNILCWNGEVFEGLDIPPSENDGIKLFGQLCDGGQDITTVLSTIEGPYAFVFYQDDQKRLYFGRDPLGRRSLLIRKPSSSHPTFVLASVANGHAEYEELSPQFIYSLSLQDFTGELNITFIPRNSMNGISKFISPVPLRRDLPPDDYAIPIDPLTNIWKEAITTYIRQLEASVALRTEDIPRLASFGENTARVSVLFSGGIDSSVIAFLAHRHIPLSEPIDLLNVAFENPRSLAVKAQPTSKAKRKRFGKGTENRNYEIDEDKKYAVPDRITGLAQVNEFRRLAPERIWNFVEINISYEESTSLRSTIEQLMAPANTIMDLSLAQALYFASRGKGIIKDPQSGEVQEYTSPARVILSGLGADELLGGYVRHRNAFKHAGWQGLLDELQLDVDRIHTRNLGRDDRIISSHGKETRYPFLSMSLLSHLSSLPVYLKVDPRVIGRNSQDDSNVELSVIPNDNSVTGVAIDALPGDKLLHRLAARQLGLLGAAGRAKRAMQFGSRSARMEEGDKKIKGGTILI